MLPIEHAAADAVQAVGSRARVWSMVTDNEKRMMREYLRSRLGMSLEECMLDALAESAESKLEHLLKLAETCDRNDLATTWGLIGCHVTRVTRVWMDRYLSAQYAPRELASEREDRERWESMARSERDRETVRGMQS